MVAVAGMEGALASVLGGLVANPVLAVPTSVGYGASMHGLSALLTMINSCANGIAVLNIDNGYGGATWRRRSTGLRREIQRKKIRENAERNKKRKRKKSRSAVKGSGSLYGSGASERVKKWENVYIWNACPASAET